MPAPSGRSKLQPHAAYSCEHVCLPKAAGDSRTPEQSPEGTTIEPERSLKWSKSCQTVPPRGGRLEAGEVHDRFDEDGVVADVRVLGVELGERAEERTAAGDVHLAHGSLEGGGGDVGSKGVDDVFPVALVQQHQSHLEIKQTREMMFSRFEQQKKHRVRGLDVGLLPSG